MKMKLFAEFLGTYFLIFVGTGAVVVNELTGYLTHVGVSLVFGLAVMSLIFTFGHLSGAHFNPAVTIAFFVHKDISWKEAVYYVLTQILAALSASGTLLFMFGNIAHLGATLPRGTWQQSFILEFILSFFLMIVIFGSAVHGKANKSFAGLSIGGMVALAAMFGGGISGASMNPARSIGPALMSGAVEHLWIYLVATVLGTVVATLVYQFVHE